MNTILTKSAKDIMTTNMTTSFPDMVMTEISKIFDANTFHHLPVLEGGICVGVISKSDYFQLQDKFTKKNIGRAEINNKMFFRSLLASEIMTPNPVCVETVDSVKKVVEIFLENRVHSVIVKEGGKCVGIITPFDILKQLN